MRTNFTHLISEYCYVFGPIFCTDSQYDLKILIDRFLHPESDISKEKQPQI